MRWQGLQPPAATVLEGTARFGLQLLGRESRVVDPVAAAAPAARSKDVLRAAKEAATAAGLRSGGSGAGAALAAAVVGSGAVGGGVSGGGGELPADEAELRRAKEAAEAMRDALAATSRAVGCFCCCGCNRGGGLARNVTATPSPTPSHRHAP